MQPAEIRNVLPPCVELKVPYFSQLDNRNNPTGSCNVTSIAMVLSFFGIKGNGQGQLEDQLYKRMLAAGLSRHSPYDLAAIVNRDYGKFGITDVFKDNATHQELKKHLAGGNPAVVHGYFTDFGHIVVITGYDNNAYGGRGAYIVNDPYGEYYEDGYDTRASGKGLRYSYRLMEDRAGKDGDFWVHFISKTKV
jgi:hypothetical protein